ncbi:hypothetical protein K1719_032605 [Acacia pycnantha]|nr:hypothetical protein K1719_032605 [Acacia pycnantha]
MLSAPTLLTPPAAARPPLLVRFPAAEILSPSFPGTTPASSVRPTQTPPRAFNRLRHPDAPSLVIEDRHSFGICHMDLMLVTVENAQSHLCVPGKQVDQSELYKLKLLEKHLKRCAEARKIGDWKNTLRESDAAIAVGADFSPQLVACKAEAYLKLHLLEDAESTLSNIPKLEGCSQTKFFAMIGEAYVPFVRAQVEMALGRFENAVAEAEKASLIDYSNVEVARVVNTVKIVARARS